MSKEKEEVTEQNILNFVLCMRRLILIVLLCDNLRIYIANY